MQYPVDRAEWFGEGDVVRVRSWADMAADFGQSDAEHSIALPRDTSFVDSMRHLCGKKFLIDQCLERGRYGFYRLEGFEGTNPEGWSWSAEMLEPVLDVEVSRPRIDPESLSSILIGGQ